MRYIDKKKQTIEILKKADVPDAEIDAEYLLEEASGMPRSRLFIELLNEMPAEAEARLDDLVRRRASREPLQYILGYQEFMGLNFKCTPDVLIPRQDTEILVESALKRINELRGRKKENETGYLNAGSNSELKCLDLCTGSGCIPISIVKLAGNIQCIASDISVRALGVAQKNATSNGADVTFIQSDLWEKIEGCFDIITSNPPYIESKIIEELMPEVREFEPRLALDGGGDGIVFYRKIAEKAAEHLKSGGYILMEIGDTQGSSVSELMKAAGFENVKVIKDLAGLDRVVEAQKP